MAIMDTKLDAIKEIVVAGINHVVEKVGRSEEARTQTESRFAALLQIGSSVLRNGERLTEERVKELVTAVATEFLDDGDVSEEKCSSEQPASPGSPGGARAVVLPRLTTTTTTNAPAQKENRRPTTAGITPDSVTAENQRNFYLRPKHKTLTGLYNEWTGKDLSLIHI